MPDHLTVTSWDHLALALEEADRTLDPPIPVHVRWSGEWYAPALLHGWQRSDDRGDDWLGCVEYDRETTRRFVFAAGRQTPTWDIERAKESRNRPFLGRSAHPLTHRAFPQVG